VNDFRIPELPVLWLGRPFQRFRFFPAAFCPSLSLAPSWRIAISRTFERKGRALKLLATRRSSFLVFSFPGPWRQNCCPTTSADVIPPLLFFFLRCFGLARFYFYSPFATRAGFCEPRCSDCFWTPLSLRFAMFSSFFPPCFFFVFIRLLFPSPVFPLPPTPAISPSSIAQSSAVANDFATPSALYRALPLCNFPSSRVACQVFFFFQVSPLFPTSMYDKIDPPCRCRAVLQRPRERSHFRVRHPSF